MSLFDFIMFSYPLKPSLFFHHTLSLKPNRLSPGGAEGGDSLEFLVVNRGHRCGLQVLLEKMILSICELEITSALRSSAFVVVVK